MGETVPETQRDRTTRTTQDLVADDMLTQVGEMEITEEVEVREGGW